MRRGIVGLGLAALVVSALTAPPVVANDVQAAAVTPAANPSIEEVCGLDATLILDASGSIKQSGAVNTVRGAADDLIAALKDTNSTLRVTQFATFSGELSARVPVNATTTGPAGALTKAVANYYTPPPPKPAGVTIVNGNQSELTWTNWEDGLKGVDRPELAIYMTDGDPTAYNKSATQTYVDASSTGTALDNAITQANVLKNAGTRMLVVGVGSGLTSTSSQDRLKKISGPLLEKSPTALQGKTINEVDAVAFKDFEALGTFLRSVVTSLCGNSVTIQKLAQSSADAEYTPATGWDMRVQPSVPGGFSWVDPTGPDNSAQTRATSGAQGTAAFQWKPKQANQTATVNVTETVKSGFTAENWTCDIKADDGTTSTVNGTITNGSPSFQFTMQPSDVAACKIYNAFNYNAGISIVKTPLDDPVRGNALGWNEVYSFEVTNTGNAPLTVNKPIDPQCSAISAPTGPGAPNGKLQPGDTWTYTCDAKIGPVATVTGPLNHTNSVAVTGIAPNGHSVSATDNASVVVKTPKIHLEKTARKFNGDPIINDTVVAGTKVTYVYTVTNTGNDTLNLVRASAVTDDKCSPVTYVSGDTNNNQKLETTETWIYNCSKVLNPPSDVTSITNTATVTSTWSNPQSQEQNNGAVTDSDQMTINIDRSASLRIVKVTNPGQVDKNFPFTVSGQGVPADDQSFNLNTSPLPSTPPASRTIELDGPDGAGSAYTVTETAQTGWTLTNVTCDSRTPPVVVGSVLTVTIHPEEDVTCTFTNQRQPSLTVYKQTSPNGSTADFGFSVSRGTPATFTLSDGENQPFAALAPGAITITEGTVPAGWELDDIVCVGTDNPVYDVDNGKVVLNLAYGEHARCLYTNAELPPATLTIVKDDQPATWDPTFDFTASGTGLFTPGHPGSDTFGLELGKWKSYSVHPAAGGTEYTVTEGAQPTPPADNSAFKLTSVECIRKSDHHPVTGDTNTGEVKVTLMPGDVAVCTYVNQQLPRLTITKNAVNPADPADDTAFGFTSNGLTPADPFDLANGDSQIFRSIPLGADWVVTEAAPPADWTLTGLDCSGQGSSRVTTDIGGRQVLSASLTYGDDVVCTFVNTKEPPKAYLVVLKQTDPPNASDLFSFNAAGGVGFDEDFQLAGGDSQSYEVDPGTYTVTEAGKAGWILQDAYCRISSDNETRLPGSPGSGTASVTLLNNEVGVCVFENQKLGSLSVHKVTDVSSTTSFPFTAVSVPDALSPASFNLQGGQSRDYTGIKAGNAVTLTETVPTDAPDRWQLNDIACNGADDATYNLSTGKANFTVGAGQDVSCTYTNAKVPPATVQIVKAADPADGTEFDFTASGAEGGVLPDDQEFSLAPDGTIAVKTMEVYPAAGGEVFTFAEGSLPDLWNLVNPVKCFNDGQDIGDAAGRQIDVTINPGDTVTCVFRNVKDASLKVVKEAPDDPTKAFAFRATFGASSLDFSLRDQESNSWDTLPAGDYDVKERFLPPDWYLDGPNGEHPTCAGASGVDYNAVALGARVTLAPGDEAVCTFANFFNYDPKMELRKTPDRTVVLEGQPVVYTYALKNTGNVALTPVGALNAIIEDNKCSPVSATTPTPTPPLAPGATWTFTCTVAHMTADKATNTATATMKDPTETVLTATDIATVELRVPDLSIVKTVDQPIVYPGTEVRYSYVLTNTGEVPFEKDVLNQSAWVTDDKCSNVIFDSGDVTNIRVLDPGEAWTFFCFSEISEDTVNTASVTATPFIPASPQSGPKQTGDPITKTDTAEVEVIQKDITITKTPSAPGGVMQGGVLYVPAGTEVTFTYEVSSGDATVPMDVLDVSDNKCAPVEYQSGDDGDEQVEPGETWIYTCRSTFSGSQTVHNTVVVTAVEPILGGLATDDDEATVSSYQGSIAIKKSPSAEVVAKGSPVTYTYHVLNDGNVDLTDVTATDDKCAPLVYKSGDDGDNIMQVDEVWVYECTAILNDDTVNVATATGTTPSGGKVKDETSVKVFVVGGSLKPAIAVSKKASAIQVDSGGSVTYTYTVTNPGNMPLANVRMTDDKCAPVTYVSGDDNGDGLLTGPETNDFPDETWVYTCTTSIQKTTVNTVTALGSPWSAGQVVGPDVSAQAQATVTVTGKKPLPIVVDPSGKCKGSTCTLVKKSKTNKHGTLKYRVRCRPVGSSAAGEVSYCRTHISKKGRVTVQVKGYKKVRVSLWITATPKPKYKDEWKPSTWKKTWVLRPKR